MDVKVAVGGSMSVVNDFLYLFTMGFSLAWSGIILYCVARLGSWRKPKSDASYTPSVSVIIAAWKEGKRIAEVVRSVRKQEYPKKKVEVIVVGGGDEETVDVCKALRREGAIKFLEERVRAGKWKALNRAIDFSRNDVIAFTDADCVACRGWLRNIVSSLSEEDVMGALGNVDSFGKNFISRAYDVLMPIYNMFSFLAGIPFFCGWCSAFKRDVFRKVRFRDSAVEDFVFINEVRRNKMKIVFCDDARVKHKYPLTIGGLFNAHLRVVVGTYRSLIRHPVIMLGLLMSFFGIVANAAVVYGYLAPNQGIDLTYIPVFAVVPIFAALYYMRKFGKMDRLRSIADLAAMIVILSAFNLVSAIVFLTGQKVEWKIYKK